MFVTGASGFLGRHLVRRAESAAWAVVAPSSTAMDIADRTETLAAITAAAPDVVVHLAYRKGDRRVIVDGTHHVAEAAATAHARLIHVSTDVVFGGRAAPYIEGDRPDPIIEYGRHKADAEVAVSQRAPDAVDRADLAALRHHRPVTVPARAHERAPLGQLTDDVLQR